MNERTQHAAALHPAIQPKWTRRISHRSSTFSLDPLRCVSFNFQECNCYRHWVSHTRQSIRSLIRTFAFYAFFVTTIGVSVGCCCCFHSKWISFVSSMVMHLRLESAHHEYRRRRDRHPLDSLTERIRGKQFSDRRRFSTLKNGIFRSIPIQPFHKHRPKCNRKKLSPISFLVRWTRPFSVSLRLHSSSWD